MALGMTGIRHYIATSWKQADPERVFLCNYMELGDQFHGSESRESEMRNGHGMQEEQR